MFSVLGPQPVRLALELLHKACWCYSMFVAKLGVLFRVLLSNANEGGERYCYPLREGQVHDIAVLCLVVFFVPPSYIPWPSGLAAVQTRGGLLVAVGLLLEC